MARVGRPRKVEKAAVEVIKESLPVETKTEQVETVIAEAPKEVAAPPPAKLLTPEQEAVAESRKVLNVPLDVAQEFFESPEGFIVVGEKGRGKVWCRAANGGRGMFINPLR